MGVDMGGGQEPWGEEGLDLGGRGYMVVMCQGEEGLDLE